MMLSTDKRAYAGFRYVAEFLKGTAADPAAAELTVHRDELDGVIARMTTLAERREAGRGETLALTKEQAVRRRRIELEYLTPVRRLTRRIAGTDEGLRGVLQVRAGQDLVALVATGRALATAAKAQAEAFTKAGLKPDFATRLTAELDALQGLLDQKAKRAAEVSGAVAGLRQEAKRGRAVVALVDGVLSPVLERHPEMLREWKSLRRRVTVPVSAGVEPEGSPPSAQPVVAETPEVKAA